MELLPGDRDNLAIQTRGGPEKHEVTGWVLVSVIYSYIYIHIIRGDMTLFIQREVVVQQLQYKVGKTANIPK